ncbi:MAG: anhydro-N-acetylmuramic acid kinase [Salinibacterium sp.]|nr:anhydro-N-acetylmuramic acid kinase [Salinibacterium sp.]
MRILSLQSGTSADGIDVAIVDIGIDTTAAGSDSRTPFLTLRPLLTRTVAWIPELRARVLALADGCHVDAEELCRLDTLIGQEFAAAALAAMRQIGTPVELVVSHGQTVFHWVADGHARGTLQLGEASWIAEATTAPVLCNLRAADIAAGGEGAPLMSVFDRAWLAPSAADRGGPAATVNLGGIANLSVVGSDGTVMAWDTGPGNVLIDAVVARATNNAARFDIDGRLAAAGRVDDRLLSALLDHPYLLRAAPKSTGRETFGLPFVDSALDLVKGWPPLSLEDLVATLTRLTARSIGAALRAGGAELPARLIASGGGVRNPSLMSELGSELAVDEIVLVSSDECGIDPDFKESLMFALLGFLSWYGVPCELPASAPGRARLAGQLAFGPAPVRMPTPLDGIRGLHVLPWQAITPAAVGRSGR